MRQALYDRIGSDYNRTRKADGFIAERLKRFLQPEIEKVYLDVGCGTGNYTSLLAGEGYKFYGIDPSFQMLGTAKTRVPGKNVNWFSGNAESLPFRDDCFSGAIATLTIHHWRNREKGFQELSRVLKKESLLVIFTAFPEQMKGYWLNYYFPQMMADSTRQMPDFQSIERGLANAGFEIRETEKYFVKPDLEDLFLYAGKQKPEFYLDERIRKGISSFSNLANKDEVRNGLEKLAEDIQTGKIKETIRQYENDSGDYVFVTAAADGVKR